MMFYKPEDIVRWAHNAAVLRVFALRLSRGRPLSLANRISWGIVDKYLDKTAKEQICYLASISQSSRDYCNELLRFCNIDGDNLVSLQPIDSFIIRACALLSMDKHRKVLAAHFNGQSQQSQAVS